MSRTLGTADELERRRRRAVDLLQAGQDPPATIARILGVHVNTLSRWKRLANSLRGLAAKPHPGPTPRLSKDQLAELEVLLKAGATSHGWANDLWTAERVALVIRRHFGETFHPEHVRKLLHRRLNWTSQKPHRQAKETNAKAVAVWVDDTFPQIVRDVFRLKGTVVFIDEAGFQLAPLVRRTLAPCGETPLLKAWKRHERFSVIGAITLGIRATQPRLVFEILPRDLHATGAEIVAFLDDLRRAVKGRLTIIWDNHRIHTRAQAVQDWLARQRGMVVLEDLPSYAPELNPVEMLWAWLKYGQLANLAAKDVWELHDHLLSALEWAAFDRELLAGFFNHAHLGVHL